MRSSTVRLAKTYSPMIKFVGTRHPIPKGTGEIHAHPCTVNGLLPGSKDCVNAADFLSKLKPFQITPYKDPKKASSSGSKNPSSKKYQYVQRSLEANEVASIFDLPQRFKFKPLQDNEIDTINAGGAL